MEKWRQMLHIEPPEGWLNDPNGLCYYKNQYHVYFQHSPGSALGKTLRCWGHYCGESLLDLSYDGDVLVPELPEERNGVYSGSAVCSEGILHLFYTGNVKYIGDYDYINNGRGANVIHVTTKDGHTMSPKQVVLRNEDYPDFCSCHVRDPKVWYENGLWKMVLGARTKDSQGCVLLYQSYDLQHWGYAGCVTIQDFGYMWECPDYFKIGDRGFLSVSPQGLESSELQYQNLFQSGYFPVTGSLEANQLGKFYEWDMGFDFYAPQTFEAPDGRRILFGWMGMDNKEYNNPTTELGWQHCMTLARELTVGENGQVLQNPIRELKELRRDESAINGGEESVYPLPFELCDHVAGSFSIGFDGKLELRYSAEEKKVSMIFTDDSYGGGRTARHAAVEKCESIRMIADRSSIEVYLNDGSTVFGTRFYPEGTTVSLKLSGKLSAKVWKLEKSEA